MNPNAQTSQIGLSVKCYWVLDGTNKTYFKRDKIKAFSGYFDEDHRAWCIDNPTEDAINSLKTNGLVIQFRKFKQGNK